tara:strand:- start:48 stop:386 length:339 start_codon:yes stop_codon:yes gene_type:complete
LSDPARQDRQYLISLRLHQKVLEHLKTEPEVVLRKGLEGAAKIRGNTRGQATVMVDEWVRVLETGDLDRIHSLLTGSDEYAAEMRHLTPFINVITATERDSIYEEFKEQAVL